MSRDRTGLVIHLSMIGWVLANVWGGKVYHSDSIATMIGMVIVGLLGPVMSGLSGFMAQRRRSACLLCYPVVVFAVSRLVPALVIAYYWPIRHPMASRTLGSAEIFRIQLFRAIRWYDAAWYGLCLLALVCGVLLARRRSLAEAEE